MSNPPLNNPAARSGSAWTSDFFNARVSIACKGASPVKKTDSAIERGLMSEPRVGACLNSS